MRFATFEQDFWQLRNAEANHASRPDTFKIPPLKARANLQRGDAAKLIFEIEYEQQDGSLIIQAERIFVIVSELVAGHYIGILDSQPACIDPGTESVYLCFGTEICFSAEHIIEIARPPQEYIDWQLGLKPERRWPRGSVESQ